MGGPPAVPQALNRYAATPVGQPGVMETALNTGGCLEHPLCGVVVNKTSGLGADRITQKTIKALSLTQFGVPHYQGLARYYIQVAYPGQAGVRLLGANFERVAARAYRDIGTGRMVNLDDLEDIFRLFDPGGQQQGLVVVEEFMEHVTPSFLTRAGRDALNNAFPFFVDFGFQLYQDWNNPRLPFGRKLGRAVIAGGVGLAAGSIVGSIIAPEVTIPYLIANVVFGIIIETPVTTFTNNNISFLGELPRNLHPLE